MTLTLEFENPITEDLVTIQVDAIKHVFSQAIVGCRESDTAPDPESYCILIDSPVEVLETGEFIDKPDWITRKMIVNEIETNYIDEL